MHYKPFSFLIKFGPCVTKYVQSLLPNFKPFFVLRGVETFKDNGYEQIKENERNDDHEAYKV